MGVPYTLVGREREIVRRYLAGESTVELAAAFGVSRNPIRRVLEDAGVERRPTGRHSPVPLDIDELVAAYEAGGSCMSIARERGVDRKTVKRWLEKAGVTIDDRRRRSS